MKRLHALLLLAAVPASTSGRASTPYHADEVVEVDHSLAVPGPLEAQGGARDLGARLSVQTHFDLPPTAPTVVVHSPEGFTPDRLRLVVYLHGWEGCATGVVASGQAPCFPGGPPVPGWDLGQAHDAAGDNSLLVVPQLAWLARSGSPGRFSQPGVADAWLTALVDEVLTPDLGLVGPEAIDEVVLVAHSGGYQTALRILEHSSWPISSVVMLDALYSGADELAWWVLDAPGRRALSLHTANRNTTSQSQRLAQMVERALGERAVFEDLSRLPQFARSPEGVLVSGSPHGHAAIPRAHLQALLTEL